MAKQSLTSDGTLRALPPHLTRPPKRRRRIHHRSRPSSPLSLPPVSNTDLEKKADSLGSTQAVIETDITSLTEVTDRPLGYGTSDQRTFASQNKFGDERH